MAGYATHEIKYIFVLTQERTGSNLLCSALGDYENMRNLGEFFSVANSDPAISKDEFTEEETVAMYKHLNTGAHQQFHNKIGSKQSDLDTVNMGFEQIRTNPKPALDWMSEMPRIKIIKYQDSLWAGQQKRLSDVGLDHLQRRSDSLYIILDRKDHLAQYVSGQIALENNAWIHKNTNDHKVTLRVDHYDHWLYQKLQYYGTLYTRCPDERVLKITYEEHLIDGLNQSLIEKINEFFALWKVDTRYMGTFNDAIQRQSTVPAIEKIKSYNYDYWKPVRGPEGH